MNNSNFTNDFESPFFFVATMENASHTVLPSPSSSSSSVNFGPDESLTNVNNEKDLIVEYVRLSNSIADIDRNQSALTNLSTSLTVVLAFIIFVSSLGNLTLLATISIRKLRQRNLYLLFCELALVNFVNIVFVMAFSLLGISKGFWPLGNALCSVNAFAQEFVTLKIFFTITLMAIERAVGFVRPHLITRCLLGFFDFVNAVISTLFAAPTLFPSFAVEFFPYRYLCSIGPGSPLVYTLVKLVLYLGCLFVLLICFGSLLQHKTSDRSLPVNQQDYRAFIIESRALEEHLSLGRLVLVLAIAFFCLEGPYICLTFFMDIRNSAELLSAYANDEFEFPDNAEVFIVWLKFLQPLAFPIIIFAWCPDIWSKVVKAICQRRHQNWGPGAGQNQENDSAMASNNNNVLTLFATTNGLELRVPQIAFNQPSSTMSLGLPPIEKATTTSQMQQKVTILQSKPAGGGEPSSDESLGAGSSLKPLVISKFYRRTKSDIDESEDEKIKVKFRPRRKCVGGGGALHNGGEFKPKRQSNRQTRANARNAANPNPSWKY